MTIVSLTDQGRAETQKRMQVIPQYLRVLTDQELGQLNRILDKVNERMLQDIQEEDPTLHNKYHQLMLHHVLNKVHPNQSAEHD